MLLSGEVRCDLCYNVLCDVILDHSHLYNVCFYILDCELLEGKDCSYSLCVSEGLAQCLMQRMFNKYSKNDYLLCEDEAEQCVDVY